MYCLVLPRTAAVPQDAVDALVPQLQAVIGSHLAQWAAQGEAEGGELVKAYPAAKAMTFEVGWGGGLGHQIDRSHGSVMRWIGMDGRSWSRRIQSQGNGLPVGGWSGQGGKGVSPIGHLTSYPAS